MFRAAVFAILLALLGASPSTAEMARVLKWDSLVPPAPSMEDPFTALNADQRIELQLLAGIRAEQARGAISQVDAKYEYQVELTDKLKKDGLDVDALVAQYQRLNVEVEKRNAALRVDLDGEMVRLPGYALPLEMTGKSVREFLLVPYVGACIHTPPPPLNQTVLVTLKQSYAVDGLYEPIWVTGRMMVKRTTKSLYFIDGSADVDAGYVIEGVSVEPYRE